MNNQTIELNSGDVLSNAHDDTELVYIVNSGEITAYSLYGKFTFKEGDFFGAIDCYYGIGIFTYVAAKDTSLTSYQVKNIAEVSDVFDMYSTSYGDLVLSDENFTMDMIKMYVSLLVKCRKKDPNFRLDSRINKWELDKHNGIFAMDPDIKYDFFSANVKVAVASIADNARFNNLLHDACCEMADYLNINLDYVPPVKKAEPVKPVIVADTPEDAATNALILDELKDSCKRILAYADLDDEDEELFLDVINSFKTCNDKLSSDENIRKIRRAITENFYALYYKIFMKAVSEDFLPPYINMFLNFGYLDEELAGPEATVSLYKLSQNVETMCNSNNVFTIFNWLKLILWEEKTPSRNTLDQTYEEYIHQEFRSGKLKMQEADALSDSEMKLRFEMDNLFRNTHVMTYGKLSTFVPIIVKENILKPLPNSLLSAGLVSIVLEDIKATDFSAFYRSVVYSNEKIGISKDFVYEEYLPDIILTPCIGTNGVMWQEIEGRKRASSSRFVLPIFCTANPKQVLVNVIGKYRWELCKRIQGSYWNVISEKSLTSEFYDYLLFYKKNKELSEQQKEKIKSTLINCRSSYAEVFARDYETWVMHESKGAIKLNKISRVILAKYCPFSKAMRVGLKNNPNFTEVMEVYDKNMASAKRRFENIYKSLQTKNVDIPEEIEKTKKYYDM